MSWIISALGSKKAVSAYIGKVTQWPQDGPQDHIDSAKKLILAEVEAMRPSDLVKVEASGHADDSGNRKMQISVERVFVLPGTVVMDDAATRDAIEILEMLKETNEHLKVIASPPA